MVRTFLIFITLLFIGNAYSQDEPTFRYQSLLKGTATISPGYLLSTTQTNIYINGDLEYFPEDRISIRGDAYWFTGAQQKPSLLKNNSGISFGALYHFHHNSLDYFVGLQPGINYTQPTMRVSDSVNYNYKIVPTISPIIGVTFYVNNYFNFFFNTRYVYAHYFGYKGGSLPLEEIRIAFGLGFQIHTKKDKAI